MKFKHLTTHTCVTAKEVRKGFKYEGSSKKTCATGYLITFVRLSKEERCEKCGDQGGMEDWLQSRGFWRGKWFAVLILLSVGCLIWNWSFWILAVASGSKKIREKFFPTHPPWYWCKAAFNQESNSRLELVLSMYGKLCFREILILREKRLGLLPPFSGVLWVTDFGLKGWRKEEHSKH